MSLVGGDLYCFFEGLWYHLALNGKFMIKDNLRFEFAPSREDIFVRFLEEFDDFSEVLGFDEKGFDIKNLEKFSKHFAHNSGDDNQGLISIYKRVD